MPSAKSRRHPSPPDQAATPAPYLRIACESLVNGLRTAHECMRHAPQPGATGVMQRTAAPQGQSSTADQAGARHKGAALFHRSSKQRLLLTLSARFLGAYLSSFLSAALYAKAAGNFWHTPRAHAQQNSRALIFATPGAGLAHRASTKLARFDRARLPRKRLKPCRPPLGR